MSVESKSRKQVYVAFQRRFQGFAGWSAVKRAIVLLRIRSARLCLGLDCLPGLHVSCQLILTCKRRRGFGSEMYMLQAVACHVKPFVGVVADSR